MPAFYLPVAPWFGQDSVGTGGNQWYSCTLLLSCVLCVLSLSVVYLKRQKRKEARKEHPGACSWFPCLACHTSTTCMPAHIPTFLPCASLSLPYLTTYTLPQVALYLALHFACFALWRNFSLPVLACWAGSLLAAAACILGRRGMPTTTRHRLSLFLGMTISHLGSFTSFSSCPPFCRGEEWRNILRQSAVFGFWNFGHRQGDSSHSSHLSPSISSNNKNLFIHSKNLTPLSLLPPSPPLYHSPPLLRTSRLQGKWATLSGFHMHCMHFGFGWTFSLSGSDFHILPCLVALHGRVASALPFFQEFWSLEDEIL